MDSYKYQIYIRIGILILLIFIFLSQLRPLFDSEKFESTAATGLNNIVLNDSNGNLSSIQFPSGMILMWSGSISTIPKGWIICDGTLSTPDLRSRFLIGINPSLNQNTNLSVIESNVSGGSETVTLKPENIPYHTHPFNDAWGVMWINHCAPTPTSQYPSLGLLAAPNTWQEGTRDRDNNPTSFLSHTELSTAPYRSAIGPIKNYKGECLANGWNAPANTVLAWTTCNPFDIKQQFQYDKQTGQYLNPNMPGQCINSGDGLSPKQPFIRGCNLGLPVYNEQNFSTKFNNNNNMLFLSKNNNCLSAATGGGGVAGSTPFFTTTCNASDPAQQFTLPPEEPNISTRSDVGPIINKDGLCLDDGGSLGNNGSINCNFQECNKTNINQTWQYDFNTGLYLNPNKPGFCLDDKGDGSGMSLWSCNATNYNQLFNYSDNSLPLKNKTNKCFSSTNGLKEVDCDKNDAGQKFKVPPLKLPISPLPINLLPPYYSICYIMKK